MFVNLYRGSKHNPSIFGIKRCSIADWSSLVIYCFICILLSWWAIRSVKAEQALKVKHGSGLAASDVSLKGGPLVKLVAFSFVGGWVSGALGLGGGSIFNPLLLSMGCPP